MATRDFKDLTGAELGMVEDLAGMGIGAFGDETKPQTKLMFAIGYAFARREGDKRSFKTYYAETRLADIHGELGLDEDDEDPKES